MRNNYDSLNICKKEVFLHGRTIYRQNVDQKCSNVQVETHAYDHMNICNQTAQQKHVLFWTTMARNIKKYFVHA